MKWKATHLLIIGLEKYRLMKNSGSFYTREQWEDNQDPTCVEDAHDNVEWFDKSGPSAPPVVKGITRRPQGEGASTTKLRKPVTRACTSTTIRRGGKNRALVVTLVPGDVIELREQGCRQRRRIPLVELWHYAGKLEAKRLVAEKKAKRKAKRGH